MRALVIEDDVKLRDNISGCLAEAGFEVIGAHDGRSGIDVATQDGIDVAVVDVGLPYVSGIDIIRQVRRAGRAYPVLILTARDGWQSKVEGLEAGADDYLVKPFQKEELVARVKVLLRRSNTQTKSVLQSGPYALDTAAKSVSVNGQPVELTSYEYNLLEHLVTHAGKVLSKDALSNFLYGGDEERDSNVIEVFVRRLRKKLDPDGSISPITTYRGSGYSWEVERPQEERSADKTSGLMANREAVV
ncbi:MULTISPECIES: response regulator transcription factor [Hydrocarboniphaga]|uniref:Response regulator with CheY-like receiver domain and winged-helix DNA-binding domain protein n=1 Tax=Hydrocarboniphaga effusa AP103 TaxID=1172194 RepID=I7Z7A7_9GAMM|nr:MULTISPECIES: response regulator transcription factor [Hydrocarboniphaga]EIT67679.1 response regulator with CheY-like receiver domain and winged-helix DNA-binding domain protein [Hydrocarboniphaga effusa AP103]MDZ4080930.1 response regulator transcription factor [Hydrocarboniphaga sp.]